MNFRTGTPDPDEDDGVGLGACMGWDLVEMNMSLGSEGTKEGSIAEAVAAATAAAAVVVAG